MPVRHRLPASHCLDSTCRYMDYSGTVYLLQFGTNIHKYLFIFGTSGYKRRRKHSHLLSIERCAAKFSLSSQPAQLQCEKQTLLDKHQFMGCIIYYCLLSFFTDVEQTAGSNGSRSLHREPLQVNGRRGCNQTL
jgi:hypothetical protein